MVTHPYTIATQPYKLIIHLYTIIITYTPRYLYAQVPIPTRRNIIHNSLPRKKTQQHSIYAFKMCSQSTWIFCKNSSIIFHGMSLAISIAPNYSKFGFLHLSKTVASFWQKSKAIFRTKPKNSILLLSAVVIETKGGGFNTASTTLYIFLAKTASGKSQAIRQTKPTKNTLTLARARLAK